MKLCVFGNKKTTQSLMQHLLDNGVRPAHLVTLSTEAAKAQQISGKSDSLAELAKDNKVSIYEASNYGLRNKEDLRFFFKKRALTLAFALVGKD